MKAHLLYPDGDIDLEAPPVAGENTLVADLELDHLFAAMARGDRFLHDVARAVVLHGLDDPGHITYRQNILRDCLAEPRIIRELYAIAEEALRQEKTFWFLRAGRRPGLDVSRSVQVLEMFMQQLARLRAFAENHRHRFDSRGMTILLDTLALELDDTYVAEVKAHLAQLRFRYGTLMSARLGRGNEGTDYLLHRNARPSWKERLRMRSSHSYVVQIADRDIAGMEALSEIRDRGLRLVAAALSEATQHVLDFFTMLHAEVAFYVGCLNLHETLTGKDLPTCFPEPLPAGQPQLAAVQLSDPSLSLLTRDPVVGNDVDGDGASVIFITGANRGGKSTLLRSIGIAQLMMQCGMFVAAASYRSDLRPSVLTHFKREEDPTMTSGKLDEELRRMSDIVADITPSSLLLCNESFASTNEREGSQIASEIVTAMRDAGVKVVYVTHLFELGHRFHLEARSDSLFLRAERGGGGSRPFVVVEGEPLPTSFGADIYEKVFGEPPHVHHSV